MEEQTNVLFSVKLMNVKLLYLKEYEWKQLLFHLFQILLVKEPHAGYLKAPKVLDNNPVVLVQLGVEETHKCILNLKNYRII